MINYWAHCDSKGELKVYGFPGRKKRKKNPESIENIEESKEFLEQAYQQATISIWVSGFPEKKISCFLFFFFQILVLFQL